jgi:hypothetical protein
MQGNRFIVAMSALIYGHVGLALGFYFLFMNDSRLASIGYFMPLIGAIYGYLFALCILWMFRRG